MEKNIHTQTHTYTHAHTHTHARRHTYTHARTHTCMHARTHPHPTSTNFEEREKNEVTSRTINNHTQSHEKRTTFVIITQCR